ncbi:uncharacterized protein [Dysidea avara]|uniref:uncharacterized protein n=1 Tax=Dysidea avara TaxID=196820 RepID=UPI003321DD17
MAKTNKSQGERAVFNRAVNFVLPSTIPTHLDRSQEYALGDVLVYEKKVRFLMPWRKHRLLFTGVNLSELLLDNSLVPKVTKSETPVFDDASTSRTFGVNAKLDTEIQYSVAHFGAGASASENTILSVDFGKVERYFSNLPSLLNQQRFSAKQVHPVIQEALRNNETIFVITSLYVADKAIVYVGYKDSRGVGNNKPKSQTTQNTQPTGEQMGTSTGQVQPPAVPTTTTVPVEALSAGVGVDAEVSFTNTGKSVVKRNEPTNMAYRVTRIKLDRNGLLVPQLRTGIHHVKVKVLDEADSTDKTDPVSPK